MKRSRPTAPSSPVSSAAGLESLRCRLRELADPGIAAHAQRYFKTGPGEYGQGDRFVGIRVPTLRRLARQYRDLPFAAILGLLRSPLHEERLLALLLLVDAYGRGDEQARRRIYEAYLANMRRIDNWDLVDVSAPRIVGRHLEERPRTPLYRLARSSRLWERRIAIMATLHFIKRDEFDDTLAVARLLLADREDLIHKAVGWMLREVGKRDRRVEEAFLKAHYRDMPRTMLRYAIERLPPGRRRDYLDGVA
jgi:3-methyladenine DNA glycosylase AlkD